MKRVGSSGGVMGASSSSSASSASSSSSGFRATSTLGVESSVAGAIVCSGAARCSSTEPELDADLRETLLPDAKGLPLKNRGKASQGALRL